MINDVTNKDWSRRRFIISLTMAGLAGTFLAVDRASASDPGWVQIGSSDSFMQGQMHRFTSGNVDVYVSRQADNSISAISAKCTHRGCPVNWDSSKSQFACPCHGGRFDQNGLNVSGPPPRPLDRYQVRIDPDKKVYIKAPA